ncbi:hypothetical protein ACJJTC_019587 [Scirpophaga incertulas]
MLRGTEYGSLIREDRPPREHAPSAAPEKKNKKSLKTARPAATPTIVCLPAASTIARNRQVPATPHEEKLGSVVPNGCANNLGLPERKYQIEKERKRGNPQKIKQNHPYINVTGGRRPSQGLKAKPIAIKSGHDDEHHATRSYFEVKIRKMRVAEQTFTGGII